MNKFLLLSILALCLGCGSSKDDSQPLDTPTGLSLRQTGDDTVILDWTAVSGAARYYVFRRSDGESGQDKPVAQVTVPTYTFTGLKGGLTYTFGVQAEGHGGTLSKIAFSESLFIPDRGKMPVIEQVFTSYAYAAVTWKVSQLPSDDAPHGLCLRSGHVPTVADICLDGPAISAGKSLLQVVPNAVLEAGKTYQVRAWVKDGTDVHYSEVSTVTLPDAPAPVSLEWKEIASPATGIRIFETTSPLNGRPFHAWYALADCTGDVELRVLNPASAQTLEQQAASAGDCYVLINGGIFGTKHIGVVVSDGTPQPWRDEVDGTYWAYDKKRYPLTRGFFGVDAAGKPRCGWVSAPSAGSIFYYDRPLPTVMGEATYPLASATRPGTVMNWTPRQAISTGPLVLYEGKCTTDLQKTASGYFYSNYDIWPTDVYDGHPDRTAVGCTADGKVVLFVCDGRLARESQGAYLEEVALVMKGIGCVSALNLDGGGSTAMVAGGQRLNSKEEDGRSPYNRPVMSCIGFFKKR